VVTASVGRMTRQRRIILEELRKVKYHPSADELYRLVRRKLPRISLGTVYRNLDLLSRAGLIQRLEVGGTQKRFDGDITGHYHKRCVACGKVEDVWVQEIPAIARVVRQIADYEIIAHRLEFLGFCPDCGRRSRATSKPRKEK